MLTVKLTDVAAKEMAPGYFGKIVHSKNVTLVYWDIRAGYILPEHSHPHEQVLNLIEGTFQLMIDGETQILEAGTIAIIPSNALHTGKGITDCKITDVFYPLREDYR